MHNVLIKNSDGFTHDRTNVMKTVSDHAHRLGGRSNIVILVGSNQELYFVASEAEAYFTNTLSAKGVSIVNRRNVAYFADAKKSRDAENKAKREAREAAAPASKTDEAGVRVSHIRFGEGTVIATDDKSATIKFDGGRELKLRHGAYDVL